MMLTLALLRDIVKRVRLDWLHHPKAASVLYLRMRGTHDRRTSGMQDRCAMICRLE